MTYNLPDTSYRTQVFYQSGQWIKPQGITMIYITAIGAGSGGGGGVSAALGVSALGGGGGGTGCITRLMIPADLVQDTLKVTVGLGGAGAAAGGTGVAGGNTTVDGIPSSLSTLVFSNGAGTGGSPGGGGGGGGSAMTLQGGNLAGVGVFVSSGGGSGGAGSNPILANVTYGTLPITGPLPITAGAGGGYKDASNNSFSGGTIIGAGIVPTFSGGTAGGGNGIDCQISTLSPLIQIGGSGGGGNANGTGGRGGDGGIGCGGGGGGGGITGGAGGKGGNGLVIINCW